MKKLLLVGLIALSSFASANEITLTHRNLGPTDCAEDSCYFDFYNMTQEYGYGLSLEFGNDWGSNVFSTVQVVDELGLIVDLGELSCKNLVSDGSYDRNQNPWGWLYRSDSWDELTENGTESVQAKEGHCYLMYKSSTDQQVVVAFYVKELVKDIKVVLDQVEVFKKASISNQ